MTSILCLACQLGKGKEKKKFPFNDLDRIFLLLSKLFTDVWVSPTKSQSGYLYDAIFTNAYFIFSWLYLIFHKLDIFPCFGKFNY